MNPKAYREKQSLRRTTQSLKASSLELYARVLARLLETQKMHDFLKPLADAHRARDWPRMYHAADSLSSQKYTTATEHYVANQFSLLVKKYPFDSKLVKLNPEEAARKSFYASEMRCGRVNRKFRILQKDPSRDAFREEGKIAMAWIRSVIGTTPSYREIAWHCDFGQGASVGVHGDATHVIRKLSDEQKWTVTPGSIHHAFAGFMANHHYMEAVMPSRTYSDGSTIFSVDPEAAFDGYVSRLSIVDSNKLSFVTKTAKTHRSIAVEPLLNGFYQKGIDQVLRKKLLKVGIDLSDQSLNQRLAREGSVDDSDEGFVTIDLRAASNSNAIGPVEYLYPPDWVSLFHRTRSHYLSDRGAVKRYEMLCSMGNGFCFPVETLSFAAICYACGAGVPGIDFNVYGDDIIIRKRYAAKVLAMLKHYGFQTNTDKTFLEGPFRESCGTDWFNGEDVRPFTLDFAFDKIENFYKYLNLSNSNERTREFFAPVRALVIAALPIDFRFFRPLAGNVDTAIDSTGDEHLSSPHCVFSRENARWTWRELHHEPVQDEFRIGKWKDEPWLMGVALRGSASIPFGDHIGLPKVVFRRKTRAKVTRESYVSTSNWLPPTLHRGLVTM